jgi:hypothetical protein
MPPQNFQEILVLFRLNEIKRPIWVNIVIGLNGFIKNPEKPSNILLPQLT